MPTKKDIRNADKFIAILEAFKQGKQIQRKSMVSDWHDVDLAKMIDGSAVLYRVKRK